MEVTMQLKAVMPKTDINGFDCEIVQQSGCLVAGAAYETLFIDHYLKLVTKNDGTNQKYPRHLTLTLLITQYVEPCNIGIQVSQSDTAVCVLVLHHYESLSGIRVTEISHEEAASAVLILWITDTRNNSVSTFVIGLVTAGYDAFQPLPQDQRRHTK